MAVPQTEKFLISMRFGTTFFRGLRTHGLQLLNWFAVTRYDIVLVAFAPLLGLLTFTAVLRGWLGVFPVENAIVYQGCQAYFALVSMGFYYLRGRNSILGSNAVVFLGALTSIPTIYFSINLGFSTRIMLCSILFGLVSTATIVNIVIAHRKRFLWFQVLASLTLPFLMVVGSSAIIAGSVVLSCYIARAVHRHILLFAPFAFAQSGFKSCLAVLVQAPLVTFPLFDNLVFAVVESHFYLRYVLLYKYIAGAMNLLFSYFQYEVLFTDNSKLPRRYFLQILAATVASVISFVLFSEATLVLVFLLVYTVNISSLHLRNTIRHGLHGRHALYGLFATGLYVGVLKYGSAFLMKRNESFLLVMIGCVSLPSVLIYLERVIFERRTVEKLV